MEKLRKRRGRGRGRGCLEKNRKVGKSEIQDE